MRKTLVWILIASVFVFSVQYNFAEQRPAPRFRNELDLQRDRIRGEQVTRQVQLMQLEERIERLESSVKRLKRWQLSAGQFPAITVEEAEAELDYADQRLETAKRNTDAQQGLPDDSVAAARLAVVQANSQLQMARAAHQDRLLRLELEVIDARRQLASESRELKSLERALSRGIGSSAALPPQRLDVERAEKRLELVEARLEAQQEIGDAEEVGQEGSTP